MSLIFLILAIAALPLIFFTMFSRTSEGLKIKLGSYFIIRKFKSNFIKIRTLKDISILLLRLCCIILIILLVYDPSDVDAPSGKLILHEPEHSKREDSKFNLKLVVPDRVSDSFDEDSFFIESFVKYKKVESSDVVIIYNPSEKILERPYKDIIIFPSQKQSGSVFLQWIELFDFSPLQKVDVKIKNTGIYIKNYYPLLIKSSNQIKKYAELEDGSAIAISFSDKGRRILLFGAGLSGFWGDMGISGYFIDIIDSFISNAALSDRTENILNSKVQSEEVPVRSRIPFEIILKISCLIFLIELAVFIIKSIRFKKSLIIIIFIFCSSGLYAEDFKFIELNLKERPVDNSRIFAIIKRDLEDKTSVRIAHDYYTTFSSDLLIKGKFPEFPYLWIIDCNSTDIISPELSAALQRFINKGGMIFVDLLNSNTSCKQFYKELGSRISITGGLVPLQQDHPVYKSFYLIKSTKFSGADISATTRRTALIISEDNVMRQILARDENAVKIGVNIVLYMLSGNYKSDQVHTRQILDRLKRRELYK